MRLLLVVSAVVFLLVFTGSWAYFVHHCWFGDCGKVFQQKSSLPFIVLPAPLHFRQHSQMAKWQKRKFRDWKLLLCCSFLVEGGWEMHLKSFSHELNQGEVGDFEATLWSEHKGLGELRKFNCRFSLCEKSKWLRVFLIFRRVFGAERWSLLLTELYQVVQGSRLPLSWINRKNLTKHLWWLTLNDNTNIFSQQHNISTMWCHKSMKMMTNIQYFLVLPFLCFHHLLPSFWKC